MKADLLLAESAWISFRSLVSNWEAYWRLWICSCSPGPMSWGEMLSSLRGMILLLYLPAMASGLALGGVTLLWPMSEKLGWPAA